MGRITITDANFMVCMRAWRGLQTHRDRLHKMARRYPLILEFADWRFVLESSDEVDALTEALRGKLETHWGLAP